MRVVINDVKFNVSVIIPSYNRSQSIQRCIDSVLVQSYPPFEIIVVDDGSTDNTKLIIEKNYRHKVHYICQRNSGVSAARNRGIRAATGNWIAFLDSDDVWHTPKLECDRQLVVADDQIEFIHGNRRHIFIDGCSDTGREFHGGRYNSLEFLLKNWSIKTSTVLVKASLLSKVGGGFRTDLKTCEDYELFWRLASTAKRLGYNHCVLVDIYLEQEGLSRDKTLDLLLDNVKAVECISDFLAAREYSQLNKVVKRKLVAEIQILLSNFGRLPRKDVTLIKVVLTLFRVVPKYIYMKILTIVWNKAF